MPVVSGVVLCVVAVLPWASTGVDGVPHSSRTAAQSPAVGSGRDRLLVFDVRPVGGVSAEIAENLTGLIAAMASEEARIEVLSGPDIRALLDLETGRQALGCEDSASCLAEVAGAMDARFLISTQLGQLGSAFHLSLSLYDRQRGENVGRRAVQGTTLDELTARLRPAVSSLLMQAQPPQPPGAFPVAATATMALGVTALVVGALPAVMLAWHGRVFEQATEEQERRAALKSAQAIQQHLEAMPRSFYPALAFAGAVAGGVGGILLLSTSSSE